MLETTNADEPSDEARQERLRKAVEILRSIRKSGGARLLSDQVIGHSVGVTANTVARWMREEMTPDSATIDRLEWLAAHGRTWHLRFLPLLLTIWTPGDRRGRVQSHPEESFSAIQCLPRPDLLDDQDEFIHAVEFTLTLSADFQSMHFAPFGPDALNISLAKTDQDSPSNGVYLDTRAALRPDCPPPSLRAGDKIP